MDFFSEQAEHEPSPENVDYIADKYRGQNISAVCAVGGGSVIDTGKAVSAMLTQNSSVCDFLEGTGTKIHSGEKTPFVAVPTTSGTGSEATKNAVLSCVGADGFKKSLRHDNFVPDIALVDPELALLCPKHITAACGMDAFTQLLESYVSTKANPLTDAMSLSGLLYIKNCLVLTATTAGGAIEYRTGMAYASLLSGITLAQAGLGTVHGIAGTIGGYFDAPHGVLCGSLVCTVTKMTIEELIKGNGSHEALVKYARVGALFAEKTFSEKDTIEHATQLVETIQSWAEKLCMPRLSEFGICKRDIEKIVQNSDNKNNPVVFSKEQMAEIISEQL